ncbi:hypothetical protein JTE90_025609 [Oedothorax gibbosus]|uniref:Cyclin-K n=1 Tax=Oedothorax gibbosus TaxID=931172 RepID=A0AAV6V844_9ARAC|nr:hypothetical protein JTE90_025609 [Oedothorax gibbosus]
MNWFLAMTVLMPSWYYEKKDLKRSPSILDGIDPDRESRYRREGARFIINIGTTMGLRYDTMATGVVYFHRFYMFHSFTQFPRYVTACCCLFLAGKVEETPKKCKDIIRIAKNLLEESTFQQFGEDPKEEVMTLERILLQTIKFDLQVDHPYGHLLKYAKSLKGDKVKLQNMVQMAWTFINDSLCTTLCLQFEPEVIAIALMYLAGKLSKFEVVDWVGRTSRHSHWWDMFVEGMSIELLEDICHQVLDLYSAPTSNTPHDSPPATPLTKSTRKVSQPPSPVETTTSPAQPKPKEIPIVGQPIPRLEPGEMKRKVAPPEPKKEPPEPKSRSASEGKAIPTIVHTSPKNCQPTSPAAPIPIIDSSTKPVKHPEKPIKRTISSEAVFTTSTQQPFSQTSTDGPPTKQATTTLPATTPASSVPPPTASYAPFPNIQQPPPQIYPQQFAHPPPPVPGAPPIPPRHPIAGQFSTPPPPFNTQYPPPPPRQAPPPMSTPPPNAMSGMTQHPPPRPPGPPPVSGMIRPLLQRPPRMHGDNLYGPRSGPDYPSDRGGGRQDYDYDDYDRSYQDGSYQDPPYQDYNQGYPRPPGQFRPGFDMGMRPPPRRFLLDPQQHRKPGPRPPMAGQGTPTGIPPVRITGSM